MRLQDLCEEDLKPRLCVVYGGRFQPPHTGHLKVYQWLAAKFGRGNVFIAMSDKTNLDKEKGSISPFSFNERKHFFLGLFPDGPRGEQIVKTRNPAFKPTEVFEKFPNNKVIYVAACSQKDVDERYARSKFFEPYPMKGEAPDTEPETLETLKSAHEGAYYVVVPTFLGGMSGTQVRKALSKAEDEAMALFQKVYGEADERLFHQIRKGLENISGDDDAKS